MRPNPRPGASSLRWPVAPASLVVALGLLAACGPPMPGTVAPSASASAAAPESAAESCLATAGAARAPHAGEPAKIGVRHVLVKYRGAKNAPAGVTRTREEACLRAAKARDELRAGAELDDVVKRYSEEAGAATRGGSIGTVERHELAKPFADAAFELAVHQLSDVVETEFGFHVIFRAE